MHKGAICVGINYARTPNELNGCINDADDWSKLFHANGFDVHVLAEKQATRSNILHGLKSLIADLADGDTGVFTYSGHGTQVPDLNGDEADGWDECLCPIDMGRDGHNLIVDDELGAMFEKLAPGARLLLISDSCHSGTIMREVLDPHEPRPRLIPAERFLDSPRLMARLKKLAAKLPFNPARAPDDFVPGVVLFSGCKDDQTSSDAYIRNRACGAFSHSALPAFAKVLAARGSYADVHKEIAKTLPSREYLQSPQFHASPDDSAALLF